MVVVKTLKLGFVGLLILLLMGRQLVIASPFLTRKPCRDRKNPPKHYNYPDKFDYGFDPTPPNFKIAPGIRDNHSWRIGGWYYGQGDYSPGYDGILWFGYEITW